MPVIDIQHPHSLGQQACRAAIEAAARDLSTRFGLGPLHWDGNTLGFAREGLAGTLGVGDHAVRVRLELSPMLSLMRPLIEAEVRRYLDKYLG